MNPRYDTPLIRDLAPEILEHLRRDARLRLEELDLTRDVSMESRRRAVYRLRELGAPIAGYPSDGGYELTDKTWTIPGLRVHVTASERAVAPTIQAMTEAVKHAKTIDLIRELKRRGYKVRARREEWAV